MADPAVSAVTGTGTFYDLPRPLGPPVAALYLGAYYVLSHLALGQTALWGSSMAVRRSTWLAVRHEVHREDPEVHDDMDLAFVLGPGRRVRLARGLHVGVSARSLRGAAQVRRRFARAVRTLELNWQVHPPWLRWRDRIERARPRSATGQADCRDDDQLNEQEAGEIVEPEEASPACVRALALGLFEP